MNAHKSALPGSTLSGLALPGMALGNFAAEPESTRATELLTGLNPQQRAAVVHRGAPLLIVAGAGSGKTAVLTRRIAFLLAERGVHFGQILAITFTNKAAAEMRSRVADLVGPQAKQMWVSTFHSTCVRILRAQSSLLPGMNSNFSVYDSDDSRKLLGMIIRDRNLDSKKFSPRGVAIQISNYKNELISVEDAKIAVGEEDSAEKIIVDIYEAYQSSLRAANAFDFDDLIGETVALLQSHPAVAEYYRRRFRHVLVDEYQDTNHAQYMLIRELVGNSQPTSVKGLKNEVPQSELCVVGDADQSIYAFRGATIRNIEEFERDFSDAETILLEQNYRSTQTILSAANAVISRNVGRREKKLWTDAGAGDKIIGYVADTERDEASFIAGEIDSITEAGEFNFHDVAVFYRTNNGSRPVEEVFIRHGIPYKVVGGVRFYERKEVKDIIAYLRAVANPADSVSVRRVLNTPRRGIGDRAEACVAVYAENKDVSFFDALCAGAEGKVPLLNTRGAKQISSFVELISQLRADFVDTESDLGELVQAVLERTGYRDELAASSDPQDAARLDNLDELMSVAAEFSHEAAKIDPAETEVGEGLPEPGSLAAFLERVALVADADQLPEDDSGVVTLMTLHTAKGLEFPVVFITGLEDGQFPHMRALGDPVELSEERRLAYVGITRARRRLYLSRTLLRSNWGSPSANPESRFLQEIPGELIDWRRVEQSQNNWGDAGQNQWGQNRWNSSASQRYSNQASGSSPASSPRIGSRAMPVANYHIGEKVVHRKYGLGEVVATEGSGVQARTTFDFGSAGRITLMNAGGAPIEKL